MPNTTNFNWNLPTVGADTDTWGDELNALAQDIDTKLATFSPPATPSATVVGYMGMPQNTQDANYTLVMSDVGKDILHISGSAHAWTIPPNSSVAFPLGTIIGMTNTGSGAVTITRGSGVALRINGDSTDANRTLSQHGSVSIKKVGTDSWLLFGPVT